MRVRARVQNTGQFSAWATATQTTDAGTATVADPTAVQVASNGAGTFGVQGVVVGTPLAESALETAAGSGAYGTFAAIGIANADAYGLAMVRAMAPNDGLRRRVRVRAA